VGLTTPPPNNEDNGKNKGNQQDKDSQDKATAIRLEA
jgi:hypothetical protein